MEPPLKSRLPWIMAAGIVTVNAGMLTAAVMLSKLFPR